MGLAALVEADSIPPHRFEGEEMPIRDTLEQLHARLLAVGQELIIATSGGTWLWRRALKKQPFSASPDGNHIKQERGMQTGPEVELRDVASHIASMAAALEQADTGCDFWSMS